MKFITPMKAYVLLNLLELDTTQTLGADDGRVREEMERIANGTTQYSPPPEPVRFLATIRGYRGGNISAQEETNSTPHGVWSG